MLDIGKEKLPHKKLTQKEISVDCCKLITESSVNQKRASKCKYEADSASCKLVPSRSQSEL